MRILKGIEQLAFGSDPAIYLIDNELLIDTGSGLFFQEAKQELEQQLLDVKTIVNTHGHFSHCGANKKFRDWLKAELACHKDDKEAIEGGGSLAVPGSTPKMVTVDRTLKEGSVIRTINFTFEVVHTPGHSPGSICLYDKAKHVLVSGDTLFENGVGRTDLPGGSMPVLLDSLRKLSGYKIAYLLPSHGDVKIGGVEFLVKQMIAHAKEEAYI
ncbi:MAG: MBL fold metallo-hydrolase [Candidatus Aenigmarchaeota archaeon]|nr:MBL fold metallo-hydrolase [Candidatus Aenigmarchaeota archaeon]